MRKITDWVEVRDWRWRDERRVKPHGLVMMTIVADASWSGLVMCRNVAMDNVGLPPIFGLNGVDVLGWKEG